MTSANTAALTLNDQAADQILRSGLLQLLISLDSMEETTHDHIRGRTGTHRAALRAIEYLNRHRTSLQLEIRAIINAYNVQQLGEMVK